MIRPEPGLAERPITPRIEYVDHDAPRLEAELLPVTLAADATPRQGTATLMLAGATVLALTVAGLGIANFIADQFARAPWLGWLTAALAATGFGLLGAGIWRELAALWSLGRVDHLRADFASGDPARIMQAAKTWSASLPGAETRAEALRTLNDPDAAIALLRAGPAQDLKAAADSLSRVAALQVVAGIAAMPAPALDVLLVAWRGTRLVRQIATIHGLRPGLLGTSALMRRTALAATMVGAAEIAGNALAHGLLSNPLLAHALGETAGAGIAARRMLVLGRAAAAACNPLPSERLT